MRSTLLFDGRLSPLTFSIGFLEAPLDQVAASLRAWRLEHTREFETTKVSGPVDALLLSLQPLSIPRTKELLVTTHSQWTAYFDNSARGGEPANAVGYLAERIGCRGVAATFIPDTFRQGTLGTYGACLFAVFSAKPQEFLNYERCVGVLNDGGRWKFTDIGRALPFEEVDLYSKRKIADRFNPDLLVKYSEQLGIFVSDEKFYGKEGVLGEPRYSLPLSVPSFSLAEARRNIGL